MDKVESTSCDEGKDASVPITVEDTIVTMTATATRRLSNFVVALRPWSFTASLTPVGLGSCLAYRALGVFNIWIFLAVCVTALCVHAAGNLTNTYFDYVKGVDNKKSDDRTLVDQKLNPNDVVAMGSIAYFLGCLGFLVLVCLSPAKMEHLSLVYFGGISGSFLYTGGLGLKYVALGDVIIFLTFGPIIVLFSFISQGGPLSWTPLFYAIPLAFNTVAILHSNNTRDMRTDAAAGIVTLAIIVGETGSYIIFTFLLFTPYIAFAVLAMNVSKLFLLPVITIFQAFPHERAFRGHELTKLPQKLALLNLQLGVSYALACGLAPTDLPGLTVLSTAGTSQNSV